MLVGNIYNRIDPTIITIKNQNNLLAQTGFDLAIISSPILLLSYDSCVLFHNRSKSNVTFFFLDYLMIYTINQINSSYLIPCCVRPSHYFFTALYTKYAMVDSITADMEKPTAYNIDSSITLSHPYLHTATAVDMIASTMNAITVLVNIFFLCAIFNNQSF